MNTEQVITLSYHHSNSQMEACIKYVKCKIKNALIIIMT